MKRLLVAISMSIAGAFPPCVAAQAEPTELTARQAARLIRAGKLNSEDLVRALAEAAASKKDLNAFITLDVDGALKAARAADASARNKKFKGPLHGVPIVVKDNVHVAGMPNTAGTPGLKDFRPKANAPVV
ncbi:MAG: amidase family protein, partial [Betaproteobacteria bacterium]